MKVVSRSDRGVTYGNMHPIERDGQLPCYQSRGRVSWYAV